MATCEEPAETKSKTGKWKPGQLDLGSRFLEAREWSSLGKTWMGETTISKQANPAGQPGCVWTGSLSRRKHPALHPRALWTLSFRHRSPGAGGSWLQCLEGLRHILSQREQSLSYFSFLNQLDLFPTKFSKVLTVTQFPGEARPGDRAVAQQPQGHWGRPC